MPRRSRARVAGSQDTYTIFCARAAARASTSARAPVLMAAFYIFARTMKPAAFGTLSGVVIGIGSLGNIAASLPLTLAVEGYGWRQTVWALAVVTALAGVVVAALVRDPVRVVATGQKGSVLTLLAMPALWPCLASKAANQRSISTGRKRIFQLSSR